MCLLQRKIPPLWRTLRSEDRGEKRFISPLQRDHMIEGPTVILQRAERLLDHNLAEVLRNFGLPLARVANLRAGGGESVASLHDEKKIGVGSGLSIRYLYTFSCHVIREWKRSIQAYDMSRTPMYKQGDNKRT
ncbi:unnamed protein product [Ectocarpus sp. 8 AP-2014]